MSWWKNPKRSKFGKWLDREGIPQVEFAKKSGVSRNTIWQLCNKKDYIPRPIVWKKILTEIKKIDKTKDTHDFFS